MYATLVFDLDGTLIDSAPDIAASVNFVRGRFSLPPLPLAEVLSAIGDGIGSLLERTVPNGGDAALAIYREHHEEHCLDSTKLFPGVWEGLQRLHGQAAMAVVSNKPERFSRKILKGLGIDLFFPVVIGGDSVAARKPDPRPVLAALERVGRPAWDALMAGDSPGDLAAGRAAGTGTCAVTWGYRSAGALESARPDHVANRFEELVTLAGVEGDRRRTTFEVLGRDAFVRLSRAFYARVDRDARIRGMFPPKLDEAAERQALFLAQFFGGPYEYSERRGPPRLRMRHVPFPITPAARDAWMENMRAAIDEVAIPEPPRGILLRYFEHTATMLINAPG